MILKMAFRNLFRNEKRTFLTALAIVVGITGMVVGAAWISGIFAMFEDEGKKITGEIRITAQDFDVKEKMLDVSSNIDYREVREEIKDIKGIEKEAARIKFGSLVLKDDLEITSLGLGIEEADYDIIGFESLIYEGRFLDYNNENEILIGQKIRNKLELELGDEVTLLTSTQNGSVSALNYTVVGFFKMENGALNKSCYITLPDAEYLLDMEGCATEYLLYAKNDREIRRIQEGVKNIVDENLLVKRWNEVGLNVYLGAILPFMRMIFMIVLGVLAGVGISNTMMMVVFERRKEIGVLKALGMKNIEIIRLLSIEGIIIGLVGSIIGVIFGSLIVYYFSKKGVYLGSAIERLSSGFNLGTTVYMKASLQFVCISFMAGIIISFLATLLSIMREVRREAVENLRVE